MFKQIKNNLINIGSKEPLNWFSILVLIALDIFIVVNLFIGLDTQVDQLAKPYEKVPYNCERFYDNKFENKDSKINYVKNIANSREFRGINDRDYNYNLDMNSSASVREDIQKMKDKLIIDECNTFTKVKQLISSSKVVGGYFEDIRSLKNKLNSINRDNYQTKRDYEVNLLEKIANQKEEKSITNNNADYSKEKIQKNSKYIEEIGYDIQKIEKRILLDKRVKDLFVLNKDNKKVQKIVSSENFWYSTKIWGMKIIFLVPMLIIFWLLYVRSSKKGSSITTLIFAHSLMITLIPVFFGILELIYNILPQTFLSNILKWLELMNLKVLIFPIMILGGILAAMFLIYLVQKKLFNKQKVYLKRISKEQCAYCGVHLKNEDLHCYNCGEIQYVKCAVCSKTTKKEGLHCTQCGTEDFKIKNEEE